MTRTVSANLKSHMQGEATTLATLVTITREDAIVYRFTDHDSDIVYSGNTYLTGYGQTPSNLESTAGLSVDNMELLGAIDSAAITREDIEAGRFDGATLSIDVVNYNSVADGVMNVLTGTVGNIQYDSVTDTVVLEARSETQQLQKLIGRTYQPMCDDEFGGTRCQFDAGAVTVTGAVTTAVDASSFQDSSRAEATGYFAYGVLTWTSGDNINLSYEVQNSTDALLELYLPAYNTIQVGDTYSLVVGCDKTPTTCKTKFDNFVNFQGFPHIPGQDRILATPDVI